MSCVSLITETRPPAERTRKSTHGLRGVCTAAWCKCYLALMQREVVAAPTELATSALCNTKGANFKNGSGIQELELKWCASFLILHVVHTKTEISFSLRLSLILNLHKNGFCLMLQIRCTRFLAFLCYFLLFAGSLRCSRRLVLLTSPWQQPRKPNTSLFLRPWAGSGRAKAHISARAVTQMPFSKLWTHRPSSRTLRLLLMQAGCSAGPDSCCSLMMVINSRWRWELKYRRGEGGGGW